MGTMVISVEADFLRLLPATGCVATGRRRRLGKAGSVTIRDLEVRLPGRWSGSMSSALSSLPGVVYLTGIMFPYGITGRILEFSFWHLERSGL